MTNTLIKRIFFIPAGPNVLGGRMFMPPEGFSGAFKKFFQNKGVELKTIDQWDGKNPESTDALVAFNHPDEGSLVRIFYWLKHKITGKQKFPVNRKELKAALGAFKSKVLFQFEPPIVTPYAYKHIGRLAKLYNKVFTTADFKQKGIHFFIAPYGVDYAKDRLDKYFNVPKNKFLTLINANSVAHGFFRQELYSERLRAIKYFSDKPGFDLYGARWQKRPFPPYSHYAKYVKRCWRGAIPGPKYPILAQYKFTILFENSSFPGYVDVKFIDCFTCGAVPIYLGAPDVTKYVPPVCFIDMRKFKDYAELDKYLRSLSETQIEEYRRAAKTFILSEQFEKVFSLETFAQTVFDAVTTS